MDFSGETTGVNCIKVSQQFVEDQIGWILSKIESIVRKHDFWRMVGPQPSLS